MKGDTRRSTPPYGNSPDDNDPYANFRDTEPLARSRKRYVTPEMEKAIARLGKTYTKALRGTLTDMKYLRGLPDGDFAFVAKHIKGFVLYFRRPHLARRMFFDFSRDDMERFGLTYTGNKDKDKAEYLGKMGKIAECRGNGKEYSMMWDLAFQREKSGLLIKAQAFVDVVNERIDREWLEADEVYRGTDDNEPRNYIKNGTFEFKGPANPDGRAKGRASGSPAPYGYAAVSTSLSAAKRYFDDVAKNNEKGVPVIIVFDAAEVRRIAFGVPYALKYMKGYDSSNVRSDDLATMAIPNTFDDYGLKELRIPRSASIYGKSGKPMVKGIYIHKSGDLDLAKKAYAPLTDNVSYFDER